MAFRNKLRAFTDAWFLFDLFLVLLMVVETWAMPIVQTLTGRSTNAPLKDAAILRLFRLLRLTRMTRIMRMVPELLIMVKGMLVGIRTMSLASVLMGFITFVFSIAFRQLTQDSEIGNDKFKSVPHAAYTLMLEGLMPDNGDMMTVLSEQQWTLGVLFFMFV